MGKKIKLKQLKTSLPPLKKCHPHHLDKNKLISNELRRKNSAQNTQKPLPINPCLPLVPSEVPQVAPLQQVVEATQPFCKNVWLKAQSISTLETIIWPNKKG